MLPPSPFPPRHMHCCLPLTLDLPPQVKQQGFHDRLKQEFDIVEGYDTEASVAFIEVRAPSPPPITLGPLTSLWPRHQGIGGLDPMPFPPCRSSCVGWRT